MAVGLQTRQSPGARAGRDDNVIRRILAGAQGLRRARRLRSTSGTCAVRYVDPARRRKRGFAPYDGDVVFLEKASHPPIETLRDLPGTLHNRFGVETHIVRGEAEILGVSKKIVDFRGSQERFGGNASPVETNAAQMFPFDNRRLHAELRGANGGDIAAGPGSNDDQIEFHDGRTADFDFSIASRPLARDSNVRELTRSNKSMTSFRFARGIPCVMKTISVL